MFKNIPVHAPIYCTLTNMKLKAATFCQQFFNGMLLELQTLLYGVISLPEASVFRESKKEYIYAFWQHLVRFRLYRHRFLQINTRYAAFFEIYNIVELKF